LACSDFGLLEEEERVEMVKIPAGVKGGGSGSLGVKPVKGTRDDSEVVQVARNTCAETRSEGTDEVVVTHPSVWVSVPSSRRWGVKVD